MIRTVRAATNNANTATTTNTTKPTVIATSCRRSRGSVLVRAGPLDGLADERRRALAQLGGRAHMTARDRAHDAQQQPGAHEEDGERDDGVRAGDVGDRA